MERASVGGIALEYEISGSGEPVVFIHGAFVADTFRPLTAEPSLVDYRLITYHRRGYVGSDRTRGPVSISEQAADCLGLLRHLGLERAHVVGHSLGASIALQLAIDATEAVGSLALLEPALFVGASAESYREGQRRSAERYRQEPAEVVLDDALRIRWPGYRARLDQVLPGAFAQACRDASTVFEMDIGQLDWQFGEAEARSINTPALVVLGSESPTLHPRFGETYRLLLDWLPDSEGFVLPGATHFLQVESPAASAALAGALAAFFARHALKAT